MSALAYTEDPQAPRTLTRSLLSGAVGNWKPLDR